MKIDFAEFSDKGEREYNEDSIGSIEFNNKFLYVLADGLGGHGKGEVASQLVVETMRSQIYKDCSSKELLTHCFTKSQEILLNKQAEENDFRKMKTTAVALLINENKVSFAHIGDSRLYYIHKNKIISRTIDHSVPQMLVLTGEIKEKDIRHHEDRNRLLKVLGSDWIDNDEFEIDVLDMQAEEGMTFLLCSDGFWEWITEKQIQKVLKKKLTAKVQLDKMIEIIIKNGQGKNMDNISAMLIKIS